MIVMIEKKIREACRVCDCGKTKCEDKTQRVGFTLVELLVVVAIIGILATLITAAAFRVTSKARETTIRMKINQLESALEQYKIKFGEYPPNSSDHDAVVRHIKKRWPRCHVLQVGTGPTSSIYVDKTPLNPTSPKASAKINDRLNDRNALLFWLGGFCNGDGKYCGFNVDQSDPFGVSDARPSDAYDNEVFIELQEGVDVVEKTVSTSTSTPKETFRYIVIRDCPVVYFRGSRGGGPGAYDSSLSIDFSFLDGCSEIGTIVPYKKDATRWHNPETYQLIHPGLDGKFGSGTSARITDGGSSLTDEDYDNITNLGTSTIEALLP
jgi:type II secretion system protein G